MSHVINLRNVKAPHPHLLSASCEPTTRMEHHLDTLDPNSCTRSTTGPHSPPISTHTVSLSHWSAESQSTIAAFAFAESREWARHDTFQLIHSTDPLNDRSPASLKHIHLRGGGTAVLDAQQYLLNIQWPVAIPLVRRLLSPLG